MPQKNSDIFVLPWILMQGLTESFKLGYLKKYLSQN